MNLYDYIRWRGDVTFKVSPYNEVDNLFLSQIPYLDFKGIAEDKPVKLSKAWELYKQLNIDPQGEDYVLNEREKLVAMGAACERYGELLLMDFYREKSLEQEQQFGAITIKLPDNTLYVSYQGTDHSLIGWKENFNMTYMCPIPAQRTAVDYLYRVAEKRKGDLRIGGHSKGGNLAVYAAVSYDKKDRIISVTNNDGPGFSQGFVEKPAYQQIKSKLLTFLPQGSVVGRLLNNDTQIVIVKSEAEETLTQHDVMTWVIDVNKLVEAEENTAASEFLQQLFESWNNSLDEEQKIIFFNTVYDTMVELGIESSDEVFQHAPTIIYRVARQFTTWSDEARSTAITVLETLGRSYASTLYNTIVKR